jgi:hypothetical protein
MNYFYLLLFIVKASVCPSYQCSELPETICMSWSEGVIFLNSKGCPSKNVCSLQKAMIDYALNPQSGSYSCESSGSSDVVTGYNYCGKDLKYKKKLRKGDFPKECSQEGFSDQSCLLEDGSFLECRCGMQSKLFCSPNPDSEVFEDYWKECENDDFIVEAEFFNYYKTWFEYYVEYQSAATCAKGLFKEFSIISSKVPSSESSGGFLVTPVMFFIISYNY